MNKLKASYFKRDVLDVAPDLLGKYLVRNNNGLVSKYMITEVEAYRGEEDLACHASKGRTKRTEIMYHNGGVLYVYLIYGMYWMLNIVTGIKNSSQAVLIRGVEGINGPGKLTRKLEIDSGFKGLNITNSDKIWIAENNISVNYICTPRIGIDYSGEIWKNKLWRFIIQ